MTSAANDAKLIFGAVFSLRNMARKLGGEDDAFISYRTATYKLHYYETPANLRFVMLTDTGALSMRNVMHQIYINLWVEYGGFSLPAYPGNLLPRGQGNDALPSPSADSFFDWFVQLSRIRSRQWNAKAARAYGTNSSNWASTSSYVA